MKASPLILSAAALIVVAAGWLVLRTEKPAPPPPPDPAALHEGTMVRKTEPAEVFRRAFWRRPDATDRILHAERREWTKESSEGISFWQWFLAVEPGPALTKWLREENAFGVQPSKTAVISGAPAWFPGELSDYEIHVGGTGSSLVLLFSRDGNTLYATAAGRGFTPGVPEAAKPAAASSTTGRLPLTRPPNPPKP
jgi:hypothetical protein